MYTILQASVIVAHAKPRRLKFWLTVFVWYSCIKASTVIAAPIEMSI